MDDWEYILEDINTNNKTKPASVSVGWIKRGSFPLTGDMIPRLNIYGRLFLLYFLFFLSVC